VTWPASPGPDGLRIRQTRDATVIRVFPYAPRRPWPELLASLGGIVAWAALRMALPASPWIALGLAAALLLLLGGLGARAFVATGRGREVLEVYVGKRHLQLVYSVGGEEVRRQSLELVRLEDAVVGPGGITLLVEGGDPIELPMQRHSEEARGWMVEHLRGAGLGARRRYGHLPLASPGPVGSADADEEGVAR